MAEENLETQNQGNAGTDTGTILNQGTQDNQGGTDDQGNQQQQEQQGKNGSGGGGEEGGQNQQGNNQDGVGKWYADDWREKMAGGDEKVLKRLQRFTDPSQIFNSFQQAERKISEGGYKRPLPENPTAEELAAWRQENGVPEKPEDYELELEDGLVVGEVDEPYLEEFKKAAHEANMPQQYVNTAAKWYLENRRAEVEEAAQQDKQFRSESVETLRDEWGKDYKLNLSMIDNFFEGADDELRNNIFNARLADGSLLGDNPSALKFLAQKARELNPTATVLNTGQNDLKGVEGRIAEIEKYMRDDRKAYNKDQKAQDELMKLYEAREKLQQRK